MCEGRCQVQFYYDVDLSGETIKADPGNGKLVLREPDAKRRRYRAAPPPSAFAPLVICFAPDGGAPLTYDASSCVKTSPGSGRRPSCFLEKIVLPSATTSNTPPEEGTRLSVATSVFLAFRISSATRTA